MSDTTPAPLRAPIPTDFSANAPLSFRTDLTKDEIMGLFTELLNRGIFTLGSGLLSVSADVNASTFITLRTRPTAPDAPESSRAHPLCVIAATGARAEELRKFLEDAGVDTLHKDLFLDAAVEEPPAPEVPLILVP